METMPTNRQEQNLQENYNLNLTLLEEKVIRLVDMVKSLKVSNLSLQEKNELLHDANESLQAENQMLKNQLMKTETSLVAETKDLEELSQEKMMTKMIVDDLIRSIDSLVDPKE
jgi:cell division protein FtsB